MLCVEQFGSVGAPPQLLFDEPQPLLGSQEEGAELPQLPPELQQGLPFPPHGSDFGTHATTLQADSRSRCSNDSIAEAGSRDRRDCRLRRLERGGENNRNKRRVIARPSIKSERFVRCHETREHSDRGALGPESRKERSRADVTILNQDHPINHVFPFFPHREKGRARGNEASSRPRRGDYGASGASLFSCTAPRVEWIS